MRDISLPPQREGRRRAYAADEREDSRQVGLTVLAWLHALPFIVALGLFISAHALEDLAAAALPFGLYGLSLAGLAVRSPSTWKLAVVAEALLLAGWVTLAGLLSLAPVGEDPMARLLRDFSLTLCLLPTGLALTSFLVLIRPRTRLVYGVRPGAR